MLVSVGVNVVDIVDVIEGVNDAVMLDVIVDVSVLVTVVVKSADGVTVALSVVCGLGVIEMLGVMVTVLLNGRSVVVMLALGLGIWLCTEG